MPAVSVIMAIMFKFGVRPAILQFEDDQAGLDSSYEARQSDVRLLNLLLLLILRAGPLFQDGAKIRFSVK